MSVEDVDNVDDVGIQPKAIPKKASRILELADGSDDDEDDEPIIIDGDTEINESEDETPSETAEAELGKRPCLLKKYVNNKIRETFE